MEKLNKPMIGCNHYGIWVDTTKPTTGVFSMNGLEWIGEEFYNAIDLDYEIVLEEHIKTCELGEDADHSGCEEIEQYDCSGSDWLIGYIKGKDGKFDIDPEAEYSAIMRTDSNVIQVLKSKWVIKGNFCSPCYPGQVDGNTPGNILGWAPPPEVVGDINDELKNRIFDYQDYCKG